jgi:putative spermidine/putrescine transport system permease protein
MRAASTFFWRRPYWYLALLLLPPLLWFGTVYLGSLFALLAQSFYRIDDFTAQIVREPTLDTYKQLVTQPANVDIVLRTLFMAVAVTVACALIALPIATYMARYAGGRMKALFYVGVMLPMWTSYLVKVYSWRLLLAKEGIIAWCFGKLGLSGLLDALLATPGIGGPSLSSSYIGMFLVFVYMWLPFMILPMAAALERVPGSLLQASADLGATPAQTFRNVVLPLAVPGIAAGSVFTFSLSLGDYITVQLVGGTGQMLGNLVYQNFSTDLPFAAAVAVLPLLVMAAYLLTIRRTGALDRL